MAIVVVRHGHPGPDDEGYAQDLAEGLMQTVSALERSPQMFDSALDEALLHVCARLSVNPDASDLRTWEAVVAAMQLGSAAFCAAGRSDGVIECRIADRSMSIPATGAQYYANAGNWLTAFWLSIVCREQSRMTDLCAIPLGRLQESGVEYDAYVYSWIDALQSYWLERPGLGEKLMAAIQQSSPEVIGVADQELVDKILYQPINLFRLFLRKDHEGFNQALVEALQSHKEFWTATEEREGDVRGYLALGPLAISCLAFDAGFPVEVESDYIPGELLNRAWLGEYPT